MTTPKWSPDPETLREMLRDHHEATSGMPLSKAEVLLVLIEMATAQTVAHCDPLECDRCNDVLKLYWQLDATLDSPTRTAYQKALRSAGIPLPDAPSEEVAIS